MNTVTNTLCRTLKLVPCTPLWLVVVLLLLSFTSVGQTTNIFGTVNSYYKVIENIPSKAAVKIDNTTGLGYGNTVLVIQMKGASISTINNSNFGDTSSLNNAGNYEVATICSITNDTVYFFHELMNDYTITDKVQLVKFGEYYSANVIDTVKAQSWDSASGKGGVIAISVQETLTLNAPVYADSAGYKGGAFHIHNSNCNFFNPVGNGYAYDATSTSEQNGAYKGEGVAEVPSNLDGGRGAPANGGGGGNNHNNGGAGGANLVAGGNGGGNFSTGTIGCTGNYQGRGGKPLSSWGGTKIFAGGGGGAGHANNTVQPYGGGNGGGIIIILANDIVGNGYKISANGQAGRSTSYDGASGGGAGGTIIMNANSYTGSLTISANGGIGGNEDDDNSSGRCYGSGGGGSGGVIYFKATVPAITTSVTGGAAGFNIDMNSCGTVVPAIAGTNGTLIPSYSYRTSLTPSSFCTGLLPVNLLSFDASITRVKKVLLQWEVSNPQDARSFAIEKSISADNWEQIGQVAAEDFNFQYQLLDENPQPGENIYRLSMIHKDNSISYSPLKRIFIAENNSFSVYPNPAKDKIRIVGKFNETSKLQLCTLTGKILLEKYLNNYDTVHDVILPSVIRGIYLLRINNRVEKLIIR